MAPIMRIMVLPGFSENAVIMATHLKEVIESVDSKLIEFVFIEPPYIVSDLDHFVDSFHPSAVIGSTDPATIPRMWWLKTRGRDSKELYETLFHIRKVLEREGPFDAVWGHSQGAGMGVITAALLERPWAHRAFVGCTHPPFKFILANAPHRPVDIDLHSAFSSVVEGATSDGFTRQFVSLLKTPICIGIGLKDKVIAPARSEFLASYYANSRIERHNGGHFISTKPSWRTFYREYIESFLPEGSQGGSDIKSPLLAEKMDLIRIKKVKAGVEAKL